MGSWGERAFDNDTVLDALPELVDRAGVLAALTPAAEAGPGWRDSDAADVAFGAAEAVAAARMGIDSYQSEGTTLFAGIAGDGDPTPYLPPEVREFIEAGVAFTDDDARLALKALDGVEIVDALRGWREPVERAQAVALTRARLMHALLD